MESGSCCSWWGLDELRILTAGADVLQHIRYMFLEVDTLCFTAGWLMEHCKYFQRRRVVACAADIARTLTPRHGPSPKFGLCDIHRVSLAMASSDTEPLHAFVQVVDDMIDASLIDKAASSCEAGPATESTYTEMNWTPACEELLRFYRERIHPTVCSVSKGKYDCANAFHRSSTDRRSPTLSNPLWKLS